MRQNVQLQKLVLICLRKTHTVPGSTKYVSTQLPTVGELSNRNLQVSKENLQLADRS